MSNDVKFLKAEFRFSVAKPNQLKDFDKSEIAIAGRSNVGKSSFLNMVFDKKIARTSKDPGRTRLLNYFEVNNSFFVVDLPGYGFAKAPKHQQKDWSELIEHYLNFSKRLKNVFLLLDIRHLPSLQDRQMLIFLQHHQIPFTIVATKADKIAKSKVSGFVQNLAKEIGVGKDNIIVVSNLDGRGKEVAIKRMLQFVGCDE